MYPLALARRWIRVGILLAVVLLVSIYSSGGGLAQAQDPLLAVVRQTETAGQNWVQISRRLEQGSIPHQVIESPDLGPKRLESVQVLLLPNVTTLNPTQFRAIQAWLRQQQGRLIVTGPLQLPAEMRATLGAFWSADLPRAANISLTPTTSNLWGKPVTAPVAGGVLLPAGSDSRLIATWAGSAAYAVIATPQVVYLGWRWGESVDAGVAQLERQWLLAALDHLWAGEQPEPSRQALPAPASPNPASTAQPRTLQPTPVARPQAGSSPAAVADPTPSPSGTQPINTLEMLAMRKELQGLVGRVESALLLTRATQKDAIPAQYEDVLAQARIVIRQLPVWVNQGEQARARQGFEQARANLWRNYPVERLTALPEVRAIWLDRGTIVEAGSEAGLAKIFDGLAKAGINTVFFETINAGFPIYPSRIAPRQNPLTQRWDPLAAGVKLAHERQIELHAWMWTFAVGNKRHNLLPAINLPENYPGPVLSAHPDWANLDDRGQLFPRGQKETWLDPANPEARRYLQALMREMIETYDVDGIQVDYIRYPFQNAGSGVTFGYGVAARQQFRQLTGVDPLGLTPQRDRSLWQLWTQFRADQVSQFVAESAAMVRKLNPGVMMSAAVYALPKNDRIQKLQQDWEVWIGAGNLDMLVPLTYAENARRLAQLVEPNLDLVSRSPVLLLPSLDLLDLPAVEFLDQMQVVRDLPTGGYALFAARHLSPELQNILSQSALSSTQIPYRTPFAAAQARMQLLQQEWQFLLDRGQIRILDPERTQWLSQTAQLSNALDTLAKDPNPAKLKKAQTALKGLQDPFSSWMRNDALEHAYRVSVWQNRLSSLQMLLRYGERALARLAG